jgi:hypothetical protein
MQIDAKRRFNRGTPSHPNGWQETWRSLWTAVTLASYVSYICFLSMVVFFCENRQEHELFTPRGNQNRWITDDVSISPPTLWQSNMAWWKRPTIRKYSHIGATYGYRFQYELKQVLPWPGRLHAILWTAELGTKTVTETLAFHIGGWNH